MRAMAALARQSGVSLLENTPVLAWSAAPDHVWVETAVARYGAEALIISSGAWSRRVLDNLELPLAIQRKTLWWQRLERPVDYAPDRFPVFISDSPAGEIYGFPVDGVDALKFANHAGGQPADPDNVDRATKDGEDRDCLELAALLLPGVRPEVVKSAVCLYARTPDTDFIVDRHPENARVVVAAGPPGTDSSSRR
jgi:glycine/D-amino acid oxidase-like deaminating enzyme